MSKWNLATVDLSPGMNTVSLSGQNAECLCVTEHEGVVRAHYRMDEHMPPHRRMLYVFTMGMQLPPVEDDSRHVGSFTKKDGQTWHVFEKKLARALT